jgi:predicted  nucleic acid-binding Zn-ribbon protein
LIEKIDSKLRGLHKEAKASNDLQKAKLDKYAKKDFVSYKNQPIIKEVREQKETIEDINRRLKDIEDLLHDLNTKLVLQDMNNATKLLEKKAGKLRERLKIAQGELDKINKCGGEMDGNCSN